MTFVVNKVFEDGRELDILSDSRPISNILYKTQKDLGEIHQPYLHLCKQIFEYEEAWF